MGDQLRLLDQLRAGGPYSLAVKMIKDQFGHNVEIRRKSLSKFGRIESTTGTARTEVSNMGFDETLVSDNLIDRLSSTNAADSQKIDVEGMTLAEGNFTFVKQILTLNGQTPVAFDTPLARITRLRIADSTPTAGDVFGYQNSATVVGGEPQEKALTHIKMDQVRQSSLKAATTIASTNYFILTQFWGDIIKGQNTSADFSLQFSTQGVFYDRYDNAVLQGEVAHTFQPFLIVEPNTDIRALVAASGTGAEIISGFEGVFADIVT